MIFTADLHIHSCLSPCASLEMSPRAVVRRAVERRLDIVGLTDHNSALNLPAFAECCRGANLLPVFGIEVNTREEVHVLTLFESPEAALEFGELIGRCLPNVPNDAVRMGDQVWVDAFDVIQGEEPRLLLSAAGLSIDDVCAETLKRGGLFIPAHIDRPAFGVFSQLGFLPDLPYTALETIGAAGAFAAVGTLGTAGTLGTENPFDTGAWPLIADSDAHELAAIGRRFTRIEMDELSFDALKAALASGKVTRNV